MEVERHFIKEEVENGIICLTYISTREQTANIFTKGLPQQSFNDYICNIDMINIYDPTRGEVLEQKPGTTTKVMAAAERTRAIAAAAPDDHI